MVNKAYFLLAVSIMFISTAFAQSKPNTYAIIIGISQYESQQITPLSYADADAKAFAAYLMSTSGGNIPEANIKLMLNEHASIATITHAMQWLSRQCKPNDKAYIYFSGHGDVETENDANNGYLLAYNTPPHSYRNNAISVNSINELANTLTLQNQTQTVIILDACRSGKLAGDIVNGKQLVNAQLKKILDKEVRLISSGPEELSAEGTYWDGGRGVFSYYLLQGLQGLADENNDQTVLLNELTAFLNASFKNDKTLAALQHKQTPITDGNGLMQLAVVNQEALQALKSNRNQQTNSLPQFAKRLSQFKKAAPAPLDIFMQKMAEIPIESMINFDSLSKINSIDFPVAFVKAYLTACDEFEYEESAFNEKHRMDGIYHYIDNFEFEQFTIDLSNQSALIDQFNRRFIEVVHQKGQAMVNAYLEGDWTELEKRQYYYSGSRSYEDYLSIVIAAKAVMPPGDPLDFLIQLHEHYVKGLVIRLKMLTNNQPKKLLPQALQHQYNALVLDPYAAPALNELGNLHLQLANFDSSKYYFDLASDQSPAWAIPWSNKIRLGLARNNLQEAKEAAIKADALQAEISFLKINKGLMYEKDEKLLEAEAAYLQAIELNDVHYLPYERLAYIYLGYGQLKKADQYFFEADGRKSEFSVNDQSFKFGVELGGLPSGLIVEEKNKCPAFGNSEIEALQPYYHLIKGLEALQDPLMDQEQSIARLNEIIHLHQELPLAHHYLGKYYAANGTWQQAGTYLQKAIKQKQKSFDYAIWQDTCLMVMLKYYDYDELEDYYLLAALYEKNNMVADAVKLYESIGILENNRQLDQATFATIEQKLDFAHENPFEMLETVVNISETPLPVLGNIKAARILMESNLYDQAEALLLKQVTLSRQAGNKRKDFLTHRSIPHLDLFYRKDMPNAYWLNINFNIENEVYNFYKMVTSIYPRYPEWHEKAGYFLYQRLKLAYDKLLPNQYKDFLKVYEEYGYPWIESEGGIFDYSTQFILPGTNDTFSIFSTQYHPVKEALNYLEHHEKLLLSNDLKPEILEALAALNSWLGNKEKAIYYYHKAIDRTPGNKSLIQQYVAYLKANGELPLAHQWMMKLQITNDLSQMHIPDFIQFQISSKATSNADDYINKLSVDPTIDSSMWIELSAAKNTYLKKYDDAILNIKLLQNIAIRDTLNFFADPTLSLADLYYAEARLYALQNKKELAITTLKKSMEYGLGYEYLLNKDPSWQSIKKTNAWKNLMRNQTFYSEYNNGGMYANFIPLGHIIIPD